MVKSNYGLKPLGSIVAINERKKEKKKENTMALKHVKYHV